MRWRSPTCASLALLALGALGCGSGKPEPKKPRSVEPAKPVRGPLLWKITTKSGKVSYLLALPPMGVVLEELPPVVWRVFDKSRVLAVKWDYRESSPPKQPAAPKQPALDLRAELGDANWERVVNALAGLEINVDGLRKAPVGVVVVFLTRYWLLEYPDPERAFIERAKAKTLPLIVLDVDFGQSNLWRRGYGVKYLREVLANLAAERDEVEQQIFRYRAGDAEALARIASSSFNAADRSDLIEEWYREIGTEWIDRARPALARGGVLIALDFDEVLRHDGMLASLVRRGYRVERVGVGTAATIHSKARPQNRLAECRAAMANAVRLAIAHHNPKMTPAEREATRRRISQSAGLRLINLCMKGGPDYVACYSGARSFAQVEACDAKQLAKAAADTAPAGQKKLELELLADRMCACKDTACARATFELLLPLARRLDAAGEKFSKRRHGAVRRLAVCAVQKGMPQDELLRRFQEMKEQAKKTK